MLFLSSILKLALLLNCLNPNFALTFEKCDAADNEFKQCLSSAVENAMRLLKNPVPELDLPSFEPLLYNHQMHLSSHNRELAVEEDISFAYFYGISTAKVPYFNIGFEEKKLEAIFVIDIFKLKVNFSFKGESYAEPLNIAGGAEGTYYNTTLTVDSNFTEYIKKEKKYIKLSDTTVDWTTDDGKIKVSSQNKKEEKHLNDLAAAHFQDMFKTAKIPYEKMLAELFKINANNVFSKVSTSEMFNL